MLFLTSLLLSLVVLTTASSCSNCDGRNVTCVDGECLPRCMNVTTSGECLQCRDSRFYGKQCENICPHTCVNSRCQLVNSRVVCTEGCVAGTVECTACPWEYTRPHCDDPCQPCTGGNCDSVMCKAGHDSSNDLIIIMASSAGFICLTVVGVLLGLVISPTHTRCKAVQRTEEQSVRTSHETGFKALPKGEVLASECGRQPVNKYKNRYENILPFDNTRVCLAVMKDEESDYINASYINGYKQEHQYIAAQDPTKSTTDDFWKMIWQEDVTRIVMLTNLVEEGSASHVIYWPCYIRQDDDVYGGVSVQCLEQTVYEHHTYRCLAMWKTDCPTRRIHHFHYTSWPVQGVPKDVTSLIDFYQLVQNSNVDEAGRTLVHSSAGVGRPGTYLALVYLIEQAKHEGRTCIYKCVYDLRFQRMLMVFTQEQYLFLYRVLIEALQTPEILTDNSLTVSLQCQYCWKKDRHSPIEHGDSIV